jgi:class 3 adenylate cyclase
MTVVLKPALFSRSRKVFIWLFVCVIPLAMACAVGWSMIVRGEEALEGIWRRHLLEEMESFRRDLHLEGQIESLMERVQYRIGLDVPPPESRFPRCTHPGADLQTASGLSKALRRELRRELGGDPLFIFVAGPDGRDVEVSTDQTLLSGVQIPSKTAVRKVLASLAGLHHRLPARYPDFLRQFQQQWGREPGLSRFRRDVDTFVRNQFGVYAEFAGSQRVCRSFSLHRFGGTRLLLYHRVIAAGTGLDAPLAGVFLVGVLERSCSVPALMKRAVRQRQNAECLRQFVMQPVMTDVEFGRQGHEFVYRQPFPNEPLNYQGVGGRSLLQRHFLPHRLRVASAADVLPLPALQVSVPARLLRHPGRMWVVLVAAFGSASCLGILIVILQGASAATWLGGPSALPFPRTFDFRAIGSGLRGRLLLAVLLAVAVPLFGLWGLVHAHLRFDRQLEMRFHLRTMNDRLEEIERVIQGHAANTVDQTAQAVPLLAQVLRQSPQALEKWVARLYETLGGVEALRFLRDDGILLAPLATVSARVPDEQGLPPHGHTILTLVTGLLHHLGRLDGAAGRELRKIPGGKVALAVAEAMSPSEISSMLITEDSIVTISMPSLAPRLFSFHLVPDQASSSPAKTTFGGILARIDSFPGLIRDVLGRVAASERLFLLPSGLFQTRIGLFPTNNSRHQTLIHGAAFPASAWRDPDLPNLARKAIHSRRDDTWWEMPADKLRLCAVRRLHGMPYVAVAVAYPGSLTPGSSEGGPSLMLWVLAGYCLLIVGAVVRILVQVFLGPIQALQAAAAHVETGHLTTSVAIATGDEFAQVGGEFNAMVRGLREHKRLRRFVADEVGGVIAAQEGALAPSAGCRVTRTVLFSHIRRFDALSLNQDPEAVVELLNTYFSEMERAIRDDQGSIDKFIGDAVMAVFAPVEGGLDPAVRACRAALRMNEALACLNEHRLRQGRFVFGHRIGIATGPMISGMIGSENGRLSLTVIGDSVNLAARLESQADRATQTGILVCGETMNRVRPWCAAAGFSCHAIGCIRVKGKQRSVAVGEIVGGGSLAATL